jgi:hypothetical protein
MPRFYCHLYAPDEFFPDKIGWDVSDLATAHKRAVMLAERVMMISALADHGPDWGRWKMQIVDDNSQRVMTVIFPFCHVHEEQTRTQEPKGARALLQHLNIFWDEVGNCRSLRTRHRPGP